MLTSDATYLSVRMERSRGAVPPVTVALYEVLVLLGIRDFNGAASTTMLARKV
jgi:hypothetical protein